MPFPTLDRRDMPFCFEGTLRRGDDAVSLVRWLDEHVGRRNYVYYVLDGIYFHVMMRNLPDAAFAFKIRWV